MHGTTFNSSCSTAPRLSVSALTQIHHLASGQPQSPLPPTSNAYTNLVSNQSPLGAFVHDTTNDYISPPFRHTLSSMLHIDSWSLSNQFVILSVGLRVLGSRMRSMRLRRYVDRRANMMNGGCDERRDGAMSQYAVVARFSKFCFGGYCGEKDL